MIVKKVGVLYHPMVVPTQAKAAEVSRHLASLGIVAWECSAWDTEKAISQTAGTDLLVTTGGDGTILRASHIALQWQVPILGINMGTVGFMTELSAAETLDGLTRIAAGEGWLEERTMLIAHLFAPKEAASPRAEFHALNDVVMARGAIARLIHVEAGIDGEAFTSYRADGVILATATGSTGYALATGGPVLYPQCRDWLLTPILPHVGSHHKLVLSPSSRVRLELFTTHQATLSIDGHINIPLDDGAVIDIGVSEKVTRFLRLKPPHEFYKRLETKLGGQKS